ncbi:type IV pilus assembly protein FimV [Thiocystis violacea]|uniref:type IV pilus assembly protein FimV n=1 Tax=Thiocystis violacea TaxID=13725 RepID=UPI001905AE5B|nr:hypothetical protein [Thiocystis violacea]MBK1724604.1 hypothetical protein [Thiocystis violacea]
MTLVEAVEDAEDAPGHRLPGRMELAFVLPASSRLRVIAPTHANDPGAFLAHQVARVPKDLRAHVQRVIFHVGGTNASGSYAALVDLFIALGSKGMPLRQRMLDTAKRLLNRGQYQALVGKLDSGLRATDSIPCAPASMLSKGTRGTGTLVERLDRHETPHLQDPLDEARSYLEYGQLDEARTLLESALLSEPSRMELHLELLAIYRATLDLESFSAMWKLQDPARNPAADAWLETADNLSTQVIAGH